MNTDSRLDIAEVVLESVFKHVIVPASVFGVSAPGMVTGAMQRQHPHRFRQVLPVSCNHASFSRSEVLGGIEAESYGIAPGGKGCRSGSDRPAFIESPDRVCGVFDDVDASLTSKCPNRIHLARQSREMHRQNRARATRDTLLHIDRIDVAIEPDIGKHWGRPDVENGVHCRAESYWRRNHFVAGTDL